MDKLFGLVVVNAIVFLSIFFMCKKRLSKNEIYITVLFSAFLSLILDIIMGLFFDTFFYFTKGLEPKDLIFHILIYPLTNFLFLNYFPFEKSKIKKIFHIFLWTILSLGIEYIYIKTGIFVYQNWTFILSAICYPILFVILYLHLLWIRNYLQKN
jgi:hypothetical protein